LTANKSTIIIRNRYFKTTKKGTSKGTARKLSNHLKYLEYRPKDGSETREDRYIFNAESDHIQRKDAVNDVMSHRCSRVDYHHLILSPDPQEPIADMHQWTRDIMHDFQEQQGKEIHWYAAEHHNTVDHPHVHVVIAGAGEVEDQEKLKPVTIYKDERELLHRSAFEHSDHELYRTMDELHKQDMQELLIDHDKTTEHTVTDEYFIR
jgi:type IV secretory pathway VirD2 relaxase